ncbi:hypothetical protein RJ640_022027 [Escallonia rubra]|uniref:Uncharacterized protein n=1 Tax=Escallonia rubra TaxID=112253 RepID=A0AA88RAZ2_9ASTE|nr:hypothetical protein RJ640_022027 [Escallonia rubra]
MADNTVFITSITGSFVGSAVHMKTSTLGNSASPGRLSRLTVRTTGRNRNACVRSHTNAKITSEVVISPHAPTEYDPNPCSIKILPPKLPAYKRLLPRFNQFLKSYPRDKSPTV